MESTGDSFLAYWLLFAVIFGVVSAAIWQSKGGSVSAGFFLGFLLGLIGLILVAVMTPGVPADPATATRECPSCKEAMRRDASVCPHCQRDSTPWRFHEGYWWSQNDQGVWHYLDNKGQWVAKT